MKRFLLIAIVLCALPAFAVTNYYVDWTNGSDSNNGTAKGTPWKHAPGMNGATGTPALATINAGDSIILKGCVTWPNAALPWAWGFNGSAGNQIYIGVDKTWWDNTVSGCASAWNRPILNGGGATTNRGNNREDMVTLYQQYTTFDNIEMTGHYAGITPSGDATDMIDLLGGSGPTGSQGVDIKNVYLHGWVNPYFCYGTGNVAANSSTITNFVPINCNAGFPTGYVAAGASVQIYPQGSYWPVQSNAPVVQTITGTNPYTITTNSSTVGSACTACNVIVGQDNEKIVSGNETGNNGAVVENSVIDGSDTAEVQINPYGDCGLTEGNNNLCIGSGTAEWRGPQIWRNNVIRFVESVAVGACTEYSGNLIEYVRTDIDPTGHTNGIECVDDFPVNNTTLFFNNVFRHSSNPNASTPGGRYSIGLGWLQPAMAAGETAYIFNNVAFDTIRNAAYERGSATGNWYIFNNSGDCGTSWDISYPCVDNGHSGDKADNNYFVTTNVTPFGSSNTLTTNLVQTPTVAAQNTTPHFDQYAPNQLYAYSPTASTNSTVGAGTNRQALCTAITAIQAAAGSACQSDTTYGATYNTSLHTATTGVRTANSRPASAAFDEGAYQYNSATSSPSTFTPWIFTKLISPEDKSWQHLQQYFHQ